MPDFDRCTCEEKGPSLDRRSFLRSGVAGLLGACLSDSLLRAPGWADAPKPKVKNCILLWMDGGPSQLDTFDPKPGTANGGPTKALDSSIRGIQVSEHLPLLAERMNKLTLVRSMTSTEGSHERARYLGHTGYAPNPTLTHASLGSIVAEEIGDSGSNLPQFVSVSSPSFGPGYLGAENAPFFVSDPLQKVENVELPPHVDAERFKKRLGLLDRMERRFGGTHLTGEVTKHHDTYRQTVRFMHAPELAAFDLERESQTVRDRYGVNGFGQGCLLARRLVETGVRFVEVTLRGWDTHQDNFTRVGSLCGELDPGFASLIDDLVERELWDSTLLLWMGEFGRKPDINEQEGRDHFTRGYSVLLGGGGVPEGLAIGSTSADGQEIADRPVSIPDLFHTVLSALEIDPATEFLTPSKRPITLVDEKAKGILEVLDAVGRV
jgi:hypothetical protein